MNLVIFIGHHKVGSTSLQTFLTNNFLTLINRGVLYPAVESKGMASNLLRAVKGKDLGGPTHINIREPHNALAFRMMSESANSWRIPPYHTGLPSVHQMLLIIKEQIAALTPSTVVLCSEVFSNFGVRCPEMIERLKAELGISDVTIVCTLRRPDEYLASWHSQRLRFGHKMGALRDDGLEEYLSDIHFNYRSLLEPWVKEFPQAKFAIRSYSDVLGEGGSIIDFFKQAGLEKKIKGLSTKSISANQSIHLGLLEVGRLALHHLETESARMLCRKMIKISSKVDLPPSKQIELFGPEKREFLFSEFQPVHDYLNKLTGKRSFFEDIDKVKEVKPYPEIETARDGVKQVWKLLRGELTEPAVKDFLKNIDIH
ncbi:hypothetical protein ACJJIW_20025 [Microbulbifer sp. JMSA004]|uniref:hypothetical protein n=1 Tax=unclassified Microbulbifer TaxID=2619833 RepID=UPI0024ADB01D|nr:hypothetical protein [Microbulbifer sp. VAAF005]WHI46638.1 hypothetical protein P0078_23530 [Microbulbifer sp. VAAF005]